MSVDISTVSVVAKALGDLNKHAVFVGGSIIPFYFPHLKEPKARATDDVDIVLNIVPKIRYHKTEKMIREQGFVNDISEGAPLSRWKLGSIIVDIVSPFKEDLGFTNPWYIDGIKDSMIVTAVDIDIQVLTIPYFLATKIAAFSQRGRNDFMGSHDIEDIITVIDIARTEDLQNQFSSSPENLKKFLVDTFSNFVSKQEFILSAEGSTNGRSTEIVTKINTIF